MLSPLNLAYVKSACILHPHWLLSQLNAFNSLPSPHSLLPMLTRRCPVLGSQAHCHRGVCLGLRCPSTAMEMKHLKQNDGSGSPFTSDFPMLTWVFLLRGLLPSQGAYIRCMAQVDTRAFPQDTSCGV